MYKVFIEPYIFFSICVVAFEILIFCFFLIKFSYMFYNCFPSTTAIFWMLRCLFVTRCKSWNAMYLQRKIRINTYVVFFLPPSVAAGGIIHTYTHAFFLERVGRTSKGLLSVEHYGGIRLFINWILTVSTIVRYIKRINYLIVITFNWYRYCKHA